MNWKVLGAVIGFLLLTRIASAAPPLTEIATKVADASKWTGKAVYAWLSERKVISWQAPPKKGDHVFIPRNPITVVAVNLDTGKEEPPTAFIKRLAHIKYTVLASRCSPDGKWMLFLTGDSTWHAVSLDGTRVIEGYAWYEGRGVAWFSDSLGWLTLSNYVRLRAIQYSLQVPKGEKKVAFAGVEAFDKYVRRDGQMRRSFNVGGRDAQSPYLLGLTSTKRILIDLQPRDAEGNVLLWEVGIGEKAAPPRLTSISLPREARLEEEVLSPDGERIAWRLKYFTKPPTGKEDDGAKVEIWISRVDGSQMHLLGAQPVKNDDSTYDYSDSWLPCRLQWVPGGNRLSFIYKSALYTLPAD